MPTAGRDNRGALNRGDIRAAEARPMRGGASTDAALALAPACMAAAETMTTRGKYLVFNRRLQSRDPHQQCMKPRVHEKASSAEAGVPWGLARRETDKNLEADQKNLRLIGPGIRLKWRQRSEKIALLRAEHNQQREEGTP